jgi:hypothetical protein
MELYDHSVYNHEFFIENATPEEVAEIILEAITSEYPPQICSWQRCCYFNGNKKKYTHARFQKCRTRSYEYKKT